MELSESGKVQKRYICGNDLVYADKGENTEKQYYVTDPHGNVVQLTDVSGKITKNYEYDSFGNEANPDSKDDIRFVTVESIMTRKQWRSTYGQGTISRQWGGF